MHWYYIYVDSVKALCYNRAKINSFILKCLEKYLENQPITPKFVLCIVYILYYTTLHKTIIGFTDIGSMEKFFWFFLYHPSYTYNFKKSTVEFHTSKNILKRIKQRTQSRQVLFYISNTHLYTLVCRFHVNKKVYWFLNSPPPFPPRTPPFWQMMVNNP